jgi:hypothetical protein
MTERPKLSRRGWGCLGAIVVVAVLIAIALAASTHTPANPNTAAGQAQIAAEAKAQAATEYKEGDFCEAAKLEENNGEYADACMIQKNKEAREKEAGQEGEATREALRRSEEGKSP